MDIRKLLRIISFVLSALFLYSVLSSVLERTVTFTTLLLWVFSLILFYFSFPFRGILDEGTQKPHKVSITIPAALIILIALAVRIGLMQDINTYHIDEYLSAHFSYSLPPFSEIDWFGVYPPIGVWICQFPLLYFFFQKVFFNIFGLTTLTMRLSELPYILAIFISLYGIGKRLCNEGVAITAITILALFSPDLYLSRWSLHFTSSTAFFLVATYFLVSSIQTGRKTHFAAFGIATGLCYATYYSSYVAAPLFALYILSLLVTKKISWKKCTNFILSGILFLYFISPLLVYAKYVDNFFTQRTEQVKLINGQWSPYQSIVITPQSVFKILETQTVISLQSLYTNGIGGHGGYWFGKLAFFDTVTLVLFGLSIIYFTIRLIYKREPEKLFLLSSLGAAFFTGMVMTIPPPAFHRISVIYPFIALLLAITLVDGYQLLQKSKKAFASPVFITLLTAILLGNVYHFSRILVEDRADDIDFPLIEQNLKDEHVTKVYIAAFDSYSLGKVLFIRSGQQIQAHTESLEGLLKKVPHNETSYIIVVYPNQETFDALNASFAKTRIINQYERHALVKIN